MQETGEEPHVSSSHHIWMTPGAKNNTAIYKILQNRKITIEDYDVFFHEQS